MSRSDTAGAKRAIRKLYFDRISIFPHNSLFLVRNKKKHKIQRKTSTARAKKHEKEKEAWKINFRGIQSERMKWQFFPYAFIVYPRVAPYWFSISVSFLDFHFPLSIYRGGIVHFAGALHSRGPRTAFDYWAPTKLIVLQQAGSPSLSFSGNLLRWLTDPLPTWLNVRKYIDNVVRQLRGASNSFSLTMWINFRK